jgi:aminobenzoyl-glutamate utilization protein A
LILQACADGIADIEETTLESNDATGSEDATYFMERVKQRGGQATVTVFLVRS